MAFVVFAIVEIDKDVDVVAAVVDDVENKIEDGGVLRGRAAAAAAAEVSFALRAESLPGLIVTPIPSSLVSSS